MAKSERVVITKGDVGNVRDIVDGELTETDPEVLAKREANRIARNEARSRLREFAKELPDTDSMKADILLIVGSGTRAGGVRRGVNFDMQIRNLFLEKNELHEMEIFKNFHIGRPQMTNKIRVFLKVPNPEDRIWVKFFPDEETYKIVGKGTNPPKTWEGFVPADENIL